MIMNPGLFISINTDESIDPGTHAVSSAPPPVIDLPHRWDENGRLLPKTSPSPCPTCRWNGDPEGFWGTGETELRELRGTDTLREPINCAWCKLFGCILFKRAEMEGRHVTENACIAGPGFHVSVLFDDTEDIYHSIFASSDTPKSDIDRYNIPRRFTSNGDHLDHRSAEWARQRLAECASSHELCKSQSGDCFLPTKLINVKPGWTGLDVRLENSSAVRPGLSYTALSYCWGGYRPACITTAETLAQNQRRIAWDKLPATFQDAVAFTRSLGIQYLWIDSVCIIQEDEDDWRREAGKMYAVYKNSCLTLAALSGSDSTSGLRNTSLKQDSQLVAELRIAQTAYPLYMRRAHYLDSLSDFKISEYLEKQALASRYPLLRRAWAYQERTVSPRVMFFTESEMIFQCVENVECECGAAQAYCQTSDIDPTNKTSIFLQTEPDSFKLQRKDLESQSPVYDPQAEYTRDLEIAKNWRDSVVTEYSLLELSMPRDRLPAIGAIAEQFKRVRTGEKYLAGLWSGSLLDDLLWRCYTAQYSSTKSKAELERPFSLPTWSWASLKCRVGYPSDGATVPLAEVLEANCSYVGGNEFGVLQSSKLVLRGRVLTCFAEWTEDSFWCSFCLHDGDAWAVFDDKGPSNLSIDMDMDKDGEQSIPSWQEIHILEISESTECGPDSPSTDWHFLLLRREDQDGLVYTRAGVATLRDRYSVDSEYSSEERQDGFGRAFEARSVLTTCEIQ